MDNKKYLRFSEGIFLPFFAYLYAKGWDNFYGEKKEKTLFYKISIISCGSGRFWGVCFLFSQNDGAC
ncbi:MAG: hypothetical protein IJM98_08545 [Oscillospiraceae bacterium]|nr:hypothetical protein [Oscillospiraceae bacterium]MBQ6802713.1 hypothetical protein [Oscillospiraceae bacterium]